MKRRGAVLCNVEHFNIVFIVLKYSVFSIQLIAQFECEPWVCISFLQMTIVVELISIKMKRSFKFIYELCSRRQTESYN